MHNTESNLSIIENYSLEHTLSEDKSVEEFIAVKILTTVMSFRRISEVFDQKCDIDCVACHHNHIYKVIQAVSDYRPVTFVLPGFPGKSPNPEKVLGHRPDFAEHISLQFLDKLSQKIKSFYPPGIQIIVCSDGRVFSDLIGMKEKHITDYQDDLRALIKTLNADSITTFNLDVVYGELSFDQMREALMKRYGNSLDYIKYKVKQGSNILASSDEKEAHRMYLGITRFLVEDATHAQQTKSRTMIQKEAKKKAYEVIRRSNAWSTLIAEQFPYAVRLSIHPQSCGAKKLGIRLVSNESWMTPWHGVAVETRSGYILLKRAEAEARGARLVRTAQGEPSHYTLDL